MKPPIKLLICCCCGNGTRGRQWWNRDTGYGLCTQCIDLCTGNETAESAKSMYGVRGEHYDLDYKAPELPWLGECSQGHTYLYQLEEDNEV